jgi:hypothetical protein
LLNTVTKVSARLSISYMMLHVNLLSSVDFGWLLLQRDANN